jgi:hypothetical protein
MRNPNINAIEMNINNGRIMQLTQHDTDQPIIYTTYNAASGLVDYECEIAPGDIVMLMNYYRQQKDKGEPII